MSLSVSSTTSQSGEEDQTSDPVPNEEESGFGRSPTDTPSGEKVGYKKEPTSKAKLENRKDISVKASSVSWFIICSC